MQAPEKLCLGTKYKCTSRAGLKKKKRWKKDEKKNVSLK